MVRNEAMPDDRCDTCGCELDDAGQCPHCDWMKLELEGLTDG